MRKKIMILFLFLFLMENCYGCQKKTEQSTQLEEVELEETSKENKTIFVYVCGAVCREGVYELEAGSRVYEAVEKAGGFSGEAAVTEINQAALLKDEEQLYIPAMGEAKAGGESESGKINLNTAEKTELMTLAGIGEAKAESIVKYREEHGRFQSIEDIKQIEGIKEGVFEKIKEFITV